MEIGVSQVVKVHKMLAKNQLTDCPCALDGDLVCEHVTSKSFTDYNFAVMVQVHQVNSKCDCSIRIVNCFIRVIPFKLL